MQDDIPPFLRSLPAAYQLRYHIGLAAKRKLPLFADAPMRELVTATLADVCRRNGYHLLDHAVAPNGLYLLLSLKPEHSVSAAVKAVKGNIWAAAKNTGRPAVLWSRGIFVRSVGTVSTAQVANYVASQFDHHGYSDSQYWQPAGYQGDLAALSTIRKSAHAVFEMNHHFVFVLARRELILDAEIAAGLLACLRESAGRQGLVVWRAEVVPDHAHLLLGLEPSQAPAEVAGRLMADSWRWMAQRYGDALRGEGLENVWKSSYYVGTAGAVTTAQVRSSLRSWGIA